jgi:hypothetical protein
VAFIDGGGGGAQQWAVWRLGIQPASGGRTMRLRRSSSLITTAVLMFASLVATARDNDPQVVRFDEDVVGLEFVGNVNNNGANSSQFGYFSYVTQLPAFNGTPEDAAHANFTFFTEAVTQRVTVNGTLKIVDRTGTTTAYLATSAPSFSDPDSFRSGPPIQVSTMQQQVILDTTTGDFSVVNVNTVTQVSPFWLAGQQYQLGKPGNRFRTILRGKTNGTPPPGFYMAGYAVGVDKH